MSNRILLVEDDTLLAESLEDLLEEYRFETIHAVNAEEALEYTFNQRFDLYIFDINLPLENGITLLKSLREANDTTPAIFLTSYDTKAKRLEGFLSGADDYITKPFDNDELILRIEAILRRSKGARTQKIGAFTIDAKRMQICYENHPLELSKKEYLLLKLLLENANSAVSKEMIIETLWEGEEGGSEGAVRVYINRLKQTLKDTPIKNIRAIGYKLVC